MADMYKTIDELLQQRGISGSKMSKDLGMSRSFMTELRKGRAKTITLETAQRVADYLGVPVSCLTEDAPVPSPAVNPITDEDIKFALFGGDGEITDDMYREVLAFAAFIKEREKGSK